MEYVKYFGTTRFWSSTPALDPTLVENYCEEENFTISQYDVGDIHHILRHISDIYCGRQIKSKYVICEREMPVVARQIMLLYISFDFSRNCRFRAEAFLSLYGNYKLRKIDIDYLIEISNKLKQIIDNESYDIFDLSALKYKEREALYEIISSWSRQHDYDFEGLRTDRLRGAFGERFDYMDNLVDWEYCSNLPPFVRKSKYLQWVRTGIAFEFRLGGDHKYCNPTLLTYTEARDKRDKLTKNFLGYWGDVTNPPYLTYGMYSFVQAAEKLYKFKYNNTYIYGAHELALFNVFAMMYEIRTGNVLPISPESIEHHVAEMSSFTTERILSDPLDNIVEGGQLNVTLPQICFSMKPLNKSNSLCLFSPFATINESIEGRARIYESVLYYCKLSKVDKEQLSQKLLLLGYRFLFNDEFIIGISYSNFN